jgi:hypothetical protein
LQRRRYAPSAVRRVMQIRFVPAPCALRGPVADSDAGTAGHGRAGASLRRVNAGAGVVADVDSPATGSPESESGSTTGSDVGSGAAGAGGVEGPT